jgi:hypothetical protein
MALNFNTLLLPVGINPSEVLLVRHALRKPEPGRSPYEIWRRNNGDYEQWQSTQEPNARSYFARPYWATFVSTPLRETLFTGIYRAQFLGKTQQPVPSMTTAGKVYPAQSQDQYQVAPIAKLSDLSERLIIDWGRSGNFYRQYADRNPKVVREIRTKFQEPKFPGFLNFNEHLSSIAELYSTWTEALKSVKGVYLLTSPRGEQYVGSATGKDGFYGRWLDYVRTGDGGNTGLKSQDTRQFKVSILSYFGDNPQENEILESEAIWKNKLGSRVNGLNRN